MAAGLGTGPLHRCEHRASRRSSPPGVPPLPLTGERTLPDVPEENYWFRRHLAVYEWIAARVGGRRVVDMACGEGYGSDVLAGERGERRRRRRQPRGPRARAAALPAPEPALRARPGRAASPSPATRRLPADDRARAGPRRDPRALQVDAGAGRRRLRLDPEPADAGAARAPRSPTTPGTCSEYRAEEFRELCEAHFAPGRDARPLPRPQAARARAGDQARLGQRPQAPRLTKPFYDRFTPAIAASDFSLAARATSTRARLPRRLPPVMTPLRASAGDLAIVLHTHMPYVEGFGTYPFGEEWLFDAVIRSYLPVLEVAARPDDDGDAGARRPARGPRARPSGCGASCVEWRIGAAEADLPQVPAECRAGLRGGARRATGTPGAARRGRAATRCAPFQRAAARGPGRAARPRPRPTPCCRCWRPGPGCALQLDAGIRSHRRRFGWDGGFWLPECAYAPGLEWRLAEAGRASGSASTRAPTSEPLEALAPVRDRGRPGGAADRLGGDLSWLWSLDGYPSDPAHAQFAGKSLRGMRIWKVGGGAYDPAAAEAAARRQARRVPRRGRGAPARLRATERGRRGLLVFAIDTELLGHWWSEGPIWLREVLDGRRGGRGAAAHRARRRWPSTSRSSGRCAASTWGEGKDLRTWDSPPVADLAWGARRLELRLLRALSAGLRGGAARARRARAARRPGERLGLPRPARPGGRLRLPARHRPRPGAAGGHRLDRPSPIRACAPSPRTSASLPCWSPEPPAR